MKISVMVSSHRRVRDLKRCLTALAQQSQPMHEILLVTRKSDAETDEALSSLEYLQLTIRRILIEDSLSPMDAYAIGLQHATGEVLAITHDDAAPLPDWIERLALGFTKSFQIGAVGGREIFPVSVTHHASELKIGKVHWYGKITGNHYQHSLGTFPVDFLTGANCAYRIDALNGVGGFEKNLCWQRDSMWFWDLSIGLRLKHAGWQCLYDSNCCVMHYPGDLFAGKGDGYWIKAARCRAQNEIYIMLSQYYKNYLFRMIYLIWCIFIGTTDNYGLVQCLRYLPKEKGRALRKYSDATKGCMQGVWLWHYNH